MWELRDNNVMRILLGMAAGTTLFVTISFGVAQVAAQEISIETIALDGDPAPGADAGSTFNRFKDVAVNGSRAVAFHASLIRVGFDDCHAGLWAGPLNNVALVACEGFPAPDTEVGTNYFGPGDGGVPNKNGQVAFTSRLRGVGLSIFGDEGIWLGSPGNLVSSSIIGRMYSCVFSSIAACMAFSSCRGQFLFK